MNDKEPNKEESTATGATTPNKAQGDTAQNLADDPILNASSINSEDYWFLKLSGNDN